MEGCSPSGRSADEGRDFHSRHSDFFRREHLVRSWMRAIEINNGEQSMLGQDLLIVICALLLAYLLTALLWPEKY